MKKRAQWEVSPFLSLLSCRGFLARQPKFINDEPKSFYGGTGETLSPKQTDVELSLATRDLLSAEDIGRDIRSR